MVPISDSESGTTVPTEATKDNPKSTAKDVAKAADTIRSTDVPIRVYPERNKKRQQAPKQPKLKPPTFPAVAKAIGAQSPTGGGQVETEEMLVAAAVTTDAKKKLRNFLNGVKWPEVLI